MMTPQFPDWGSALDCYYPWHSYAGPHGDMHAGYLLDTVIAPDVTTGKDCIYEVLRCEPCISIHVTPLPEPEALAQYYAERFYEVEKPDYLERYDRDREWWERCVHGPLLLQAARLLQESGVSGRHVLEIGAGPGIALDVAASYEWCTYAIEPSPLCATRLETLHHVFHGTLEDFGASTHARYFTMLYLYEVLEHQPCPEAFLLQCYELLAPGGVMVICVPNDYSPVQFTACEKLHLLHYWLAPPQHLHYFSPKMLQLLVRRCGFSIVDMRGTYPLERFLLGGRNYIGNDTIGREIHQIRMQDELFVLQSGLWPARERQYRRNMTEQRLGREIVCLVQKG